MTPSFTVLPTTPVSSDALPTSPENISLDQLDISTGDGFGELLNGAYESLSGPVRPVSPETVIANDLIAGLQSLPESGNPLPLLEESLQLAAAEGIGVDRIFQQVSVQLESLAPEEADAIAQLLGPALRPAAPVGTVNEPVPGSSNPNVLPAREHTTLTPAGVAEPAVKLAELIHQQLQARGVNVSDRIPAGEADSAVPQALKAESQPPLLQTGLDRIVPETRQSDLAVLMAAFKRFQADSGSRAVPAPVSSVDAAVAGSGQAAATATSGVATTALPATSIKTPFGQASWDQAVGERIQWMVSQKMQGAQVKLNPANLGPMEVRIQVQNDQVSVQFSAHHAAVREALETSLPRLKDMFESSGIELVDVDVSGQSFDRREAADGDGGEAIARQSVDPAADESGEGRVVESEIERLASTGRLDLFV